MVCLYYLLVKQVDLALHVFQHYYGELCQALRNSLKEVATMLYKKEFVSRQERDQVVNAQGLTTMRKAYILMQIIERRVLAANSATMVKKFCLVLQRHQCVGSIVSRMLSRLGT